MGKLTISMAIFNSYVSLPEGTRHKNTATDCQWILPFLIIFRPSAIGFSLKKIHPGNRL
jgi:hypothetical protein